MTYATTTAYQTAASLRARVLSLVQNDSHAKVTTEEKEVTSNGGLLVRFVAEPDNGSGFRVESPLVKIGPRGGVRFYFIPMWIREGQQGVWRSAKSPCHVPCRRDAAVR